VKLLRDCLKKNGDANARRAFWYELVYKVNNLRDGHRKKKEDDEKEKKIAVLLMKAGGLLKEIGTAIQANGSIDQSDWDNLLEQFDAIQPADPQPIDEMLEFGDWLKERKNKKEAQQNENLQKTVNGKKGNAGKAKKTTKKKNGNPSPDPP
ncbi:unnamed protein product, partial [Mesorhabditis belari]|uniref:Uncharacterized protein n=1 Tax=Mesorhabditis belari TaxID=2138241 RepID=A0AAF3FQN6_9BILA